MAGPNLRRMPLTEWSSEQTRFWSTQLNDIRFLSEQTPAAFFLTEIKLQCIFYGKRVFVADSDLINHPPFQDAFLSDASRLRSAFRHGLITLAIRDTVPNLVELNARQGSNRADPSIQDRAGVFAKAADDYLAGGDIPSLGWDIASVASSFERRVGLLLQNPRVLGGHGDLLAESVAKAKSSDAEGHLYFGPVYKYLVHQKGLAREHHLIRCVNVAHSLNACVNLGLSTCVPSEAFPPEAVSCVLQLPSYNEPLDEADKDLRLLPDPVLTDEVLDRITFDDIPGLHRIADGIGYFEALEAARKNLRTSTHIDTYIDILNKLRLYMRAIGGDRGIRLRGWQSDLVQNKIDQIELTAQDRALLWLTVPILFYSPLRIIFGISLDLTAVVTVGLLGGGLEQKRAQRKKTELESFLKGSAKISTTT